MTRHTLQDTSLDESPVCFCAEADTWPTLSPDHEEEWTQTLSALAGRAAPAALAALFSALVLCILFLRRFLTSNVSLKYFDFFLFLGRLGCVVQCRVGVIEAGSSTDAADADDKLITGAASVAAANKAAGGPVSAAAAGCAADADTAATGSSASGHCDSATAAAVEVIAMAGASGSEASAEAKVLPAVAASEALAVAA